MAQHVEINPDNESLPFSLGLKAVRLASTQKTHKTGTVRIPTSTGKDFIAGEGAEDGANWIDEEGVQTPLVDTAAIDKAVDEIGQKADAASANADKVRSDLQAEVDSVKADVSKVDDATSQLKSDAVKLSETVEANRQAAENSVNEVVDRLTSVKGELDSAVNTAQSAASKAQSAADAAQSSADKANASVVDLDKSIQSVDSKADAAKQAAAEAQSKAESVASDLDSANATIEQHSTKLGELTTKVTNAGSKADSAVTVATEAKQTATEASTTATSAYNDSQTALTQSTTATQTASSAKTTAESAAKTANDSLKQSSTAVQTANQVSTKLTTEYQTKADADKVYATQSSVTQTSDSIKSEVAKTYATKDALTALQNVADNAIESWRGSGVPTLSNKPASDWTTAEEKKKHSGDLYYDKTTGKAYRFGSDDGTTYSWDLNQDSDVTKALQDASKAQSTADGAQSTADKANTAAGKAQSTADTAVSNAATAKSAADAAQSSANAAQSDVDKLKVDIPATYATKSSVEQTASEITASVESVKTTANGAVTAASKAQQTADGISTTLSKDYQTKAQADATYATQASLKATSESITADVSKAQSTADGAVTAASKAQQTADAVTLNLSKNYSTKAQADSTYATQTNLKATSDSLTAKITANATKAQSALDKSTSLEANLNGFKTTVSETYATNAKVDGITVGGTNMLLDTRLMKTTGTTNGKLRQSSFPVVGNINGGTLNARGGIVPKNDLMFGEWTVTDFTLGDRYTLSFYIDSDVANIVNCFFHGASGYATVLATACSGGTIMRTDGYGDGHTKLTIAAAKKQRVWVTWKINASGDATIPKYVLIRGDNTTVNSNVYIYGVKLEKGSKPTDWSPAPEDLQAAGDYATNSSLEVTATSIKSQVAETYATKQEVDNVSVELNSSINQTKENISLAVQGKYSGEDNSMNNIQSSLNVTKDKVTIAFNNSQAVGGQNLLLGTASAIEVAGTNATNQTTGSYKFAVGTLKNLPVGMYHIQYKIKTTTAGGTAVVQINDTPYIAGDAVSVTTEEQSVSQSFNITSTDGNATGVQIRLDNVQGDVTITEMKLERGTAATAWSAAPEDDVANLNNRVTDTDTSITSVNNALTQVSDQLNTYTTENDTNVKDISSRLDAEIAARDAYIQFSSDSNNPMMEMGAKTSTAKMRLTNTQLQFLIGNVIAAYISNDRLNINNADVIQTLKIGKYAFVPRSDGHMTLKYVG